MADSIWSMVWSADTASTGKGAGRGKGQTRTRILEAAAQTFLRTGFTRATVEDVLGSAGVSRRTFYQFFKSKQDVLSGLFSLSSGMLVHGIRMTMSQAGPKLEDRLQAALNAYLTVQLQGGELLSILQTEAIRPDSLLNPMRTATIDALQDLVMGEISKQPGAMLQPLQARTMLLGLEALCVEMHSRNQFDQAMADRIRAQAVPLLVRMLASTEPEMAKHAVQTKPTPPRVRSAAVKKAAAQK